MSRQKARSMAEKRRLRREANAVPLAGEDWGPNTPAAKRGKKLEDVPEDANRRRRMRRADPWHDKYGLGSGLTIRQRAAADELHRLHAETQRSPGGISERVDRSPDPSAVAVMQAEILTRRAKLWGAIPHEMRPVCVHVCGKALPLRSGEPPFARDGHQASEAMALLKVALDLVANRMGI